MTLERLISKTDFKILQGGLDTEITGIAYDSRRVADGFVFVCMTGANVDGHDYIENAVANGAAAIIVSREAPMISGVTYIFVSDTRHALAMMSCEFFGNPSHELNVIGITGTKGKTTISYMIKKLLEAVGHKVGVIGTIQSIIGDRVEKAKNTTPESYELQRMLREMVDCDCDFAVLEVSSIGLKMSRVDGTRFPLGIYTNFSRDHIGRDEHATMEEYIASKSLFFRMCETALVNADCSMWEEVLGNHTCDVIFYGEKESVCIRADGIENAKREERLCVDFTLSSGEHSARVKVGLPGRYSVLNATAAMGAAIFFGEDWQKLTDALIDISVPGRTQLAAKGLPFTVLIDYAHNEISMESLLKSLREYSPNRLICLFGCGGNRDKARRLAMGEKAAKYTDLAILTEDNPRFEAPEDIIADILTGMNGKGSYEIIPDRREAIIHMLEIAQAGDICAVIGKGHEDYQDIRGVKHPFVEADIIAEWARLRTAQWQSAD